MTALELRDVVVEYERRDGARVRAVAGASLSIERGQIVGLVGESGCGKSTPRAGGGGARATTAGTVLRGHASDVPLGRARAARELVRLQLVFQNPYSSLNPRRKIGIATRRRHRGARSRVATGTPGACVRAAASSSACRPRRPTASRTSSQEVSGSESRSRGRWPPIRRYRARRAARVARCVGAGATREPARTALASSSTWAFS